MRNLILFALVLFTGSAFATNFVYSSGPHVKVVGVNQGFIAAEVYFSTPEPEDIVFQFKVLSNTVPKDWSVSLCGYGTCYVGVPGSGDFKPITKQQMESGEEGFFQLMTSPRSFESGKVQIYVYEKGNFSRGDTISLEVQHAQTASLEEASELSLEVYPNPCTDYLQLNVPSQLDVTLIQITDFTGNIVSSLEPIQGLKAIQLDIADLTAGVYLLNVYTHNGLKSKRITVID